MQWKFENWLWVIQVASYKSFNVRLTLLLFIHVWLHFQLKVWNQDSREVTKICFGNDLFQHLKDSLKGACEEGSFHFYCKPETLIKSIKIPSYLFFQDCATTQSNFFEIIGNNKNTYIPECLRMAASTRLKNSCTKWKLLNLFFHWCVSKAWNSSFKLKLIAFLKITVLIFYLITSL